MLDQIPTLPESAVGILAGVCLYIIRRVDKKLDQLFALHDRLAQRLAKQEGRCEQNHLRTTPRRKRRTQS